MASKEIRYKEQTFKLAYELVNPTQDEVLLVLHGWGSNKEIMKQAFGNTLPDYKHIYLDMPGFGKSTNEMILTTVDYANIVQLFLDTLGVTATIAMGHSFGGKVSTLLNTPYLVLLSSSIIPSAVIKIKLLFGSYHSMTLYSSSKFLTLFSSAIRMLQVIPIIFPSFFATKNPS